MSRRLLLVCTVVAVCAGCAYLDDPGLVDAATRYPPLLEMAGTSRAFRAGDWSPLPAGPGAEGRPGDFVLQNALARFVIAADDRDGLRRIAGNVIDAAVQGGEDRMRLLVALIGEGAARRPVYEAVHIEEPGDLHAAAVVVAEGRVPGWEALAVSTSYVLEPDSPALRIVTRVRNTGQRMIGSLSVGDALYHGRTLRFLPDAGLMPAGRSSSSRWMAWLIDDFCWGLHVEGALPIEGVHRAGRSELRYARLDVAPGEVRTCERLLTAAVGGAEQIWQAAHPFAESARASFVVQIADRDSGRPVADGEALVTPAGGGSPVILLADSAGRAGLDLPAGRYDVAFWGPGRPPEGHVAVTVAAGTTHVQSICMAPPAAVSVQTRVLEDGFAFPAAVRTAAYPPSDPEAPLLRLPPFPVGAWTPAVGFCAGAVVLPLLPVGPDAPATAMVVSSRGPLFRCGAQRVQAACGETVPVALTVDRAVDPGDYVSVDCRQHTDASPDSPLRAEERAAANAGEDLAAGVVSDPVWPAVPLPGAPAGDGRLIRGLRVAIDGVGAFSAYPIEPGTPLPADLHGIAAVADAVEVVRRLRRALPDAVIQVDDPLDAEAGCFALSGYDPLRQRRVPEVFGAPFDAVELRTDCGPARVEGTLSHWFALLNAGRRVALTGGSGARDLGGASCGTARTFLHCPAGDGEPTAGDLAGALRALKSAPNAVVSNGPFIEAMMNERPIGSVVDGGGRPVRLALRVYAPPWMDAGSVLIYRNGDVVETLTLEAPEGAALRADRLLELDAPRDSWFVVRVCGSRPLPALYCMTADGPPGVAVTNPFWVDADGDGEVGPVGGP